MRIFGKVALGAVFLFFFYAAMYALSRFGNTPLPAAFGLIVMFGLVSYLVGDMLLD